MPVIAPRPDHDDRFFWDGVAEGRLLVRACADCGHVQHPPTPMCPACQSLRWEPREVTGRGTVLAWIASKHPSAPDAEPRIVVLVQLDDGPRLVANLYGADTSWAINDLAVEATFVEIDGIRLPGFQPARGAA